MKKTPIILTAALLAVCLAVGLTMVFLRGDNVVTVETEDGDGAVNLVYNKATKDFELKCYKSGELIYTRSGTRGDPVYHYDANYDRIQPEQHTRLDVRLLMQL